MDHELFATLVQSLHAVAVRSFPEEEDPPKEFSEKFCYHTVLQACFSAEAFSAAAHAVPDTMIHKVQDELGIRALLFRLGGRIFVIGPYVIREFQEKAARSVLMMHRLPASFIPSLKLYYSAFPIASDPEIVHTVRALIRALGQKDEEFGYRNVTAAPGKLGETHAEEHYEVRFDYRSIQQRYERENRFLRMIEEGDTEQVLQAFDQMGASDYNNRRYLSSVYSVPEVAFAMVRALSRKAAERGGASLMEINEITQHAVQTMKGARNERAFIENLHSMILKLTEAVRRHQLSEGHYSAPIQKALSFLRLNYSQDISLVEIAAAAGYAPSYLSREFRKETGITVSAHLQRLRCAHAAELLKETVIPIAEISAYVGYPDNNYFVKVFRKHYGMTPGAYRKMS
ncbi:MAG: helix-turn-helix transcriptional regulator [Lachnospiraceae bacterium]|nr:helix-turn-helix transcriptional regulator [Lachnospiraceae bacterium]